MIWFLACTGPEAEPEPEDEAATFPDDFRWGTATAGFQVDMGCPTWPAQQCEDRASDWYAWVTSPEITGDPSLYVTGEPVSNGPGMWETFEDDVEVMVADGMSAFRLSIEWSRLFPEDAESATTVDELEGFADAGAVARYHEMFAALSAAGIEPVVTLNHYTLPLWVHDGVGCHADPECAASGWVDGPRITRLIGLYSGFAAREFGGEVELWATLNEPFATTLSGYAFPSEDRSGPPGLSLDIDGTIAVMLHQIEGHAAMYDAVHAEDATARVGIVMNMTAIHPVDAENELDVRAVEHVDYLYHQLYLGAFTDGDWDEDLDGTPEETRADLAGRLDWLGINYYNEIKVRGFPFSVIEEIPLFDFYPEITWEPYEPGIAEVVTRAEAWGVPMWITENGTPYVDERGADVLAGHLQHLRDVIADGADVDGYLYWSYVDNYEWNHGFDLRFGLYELDTASKERTPRPVRDRYVEIIATGSPD